VTDGRTLTGTDIVVADLGTWRGTGDGVALDPERGRLLFPGSPPRSCEVRYAYRVPGRIGGGPYDRGDSLTEPPPGGRAFTVRGTGTAPFGALADALRADHGAADVLTILDDAVATG
jgi:hypothetical protein